MSSRTTGGEERSSTAIPNDNVQTIDGSSAGIYRPLTETVRASVHPHVSLASLTSTSPRSWAKPPRAKSPSPSVSAWPPRNPLTVAASHMA